MSAFHPLETRLADAWPPEDWQDVTVLLAVSGGADSVALLRAMVALKTTGEGRLVAAHLNHQLRPWRPRATMPWSSSSAGGWAWRAKWAGCGST